MKKTSVYLTERELARVAWLAERQGLSQAEVIRQAIDAYAPDPGGDRDFRLIGSGRGPGDSVADLSEENLLESFGE
jgi:Ribbon-helix-helix protein, copG family